MPLCARPAATDLGLESGISCFSDGNYGCAVQHREGSFWAHDALASFRQAPLLNLAATVFGLESVISSFSDRNYGCAVQYSEGSVLAHDGLASFRQALLLDLAATDRGMKSVTSCFSDGHYGCAVQVSEGSLLAHDARAPFRQARLLGMAATPRSPDTNQHDDKGPAAVAEVKGQGSTNRQGYLGPGSRIGEAAQPGPGIDDPEDFPSENEEGREGESDQTAASQGTDQVAALHGGLTHSLTPRRQGTDTPAPMRISLEQLLLPSTALSAMLTAIEGWHGAIQQRR